VYETSVQIQVKECWGYMVLNPFFLFLTLPKRHNTCSSVSNGYTTDKQIALCNFINGIANLPCFRINQMQHICEKCTKLCGQNTFAFAFPTILFILRLPQDIACHAPIGGCNLGYLCATLVTHTTSGTWAAAKTNRLPLQWQQPLLLWHKQWQGHNLLNTLLHMPPASDSQT